MDDDEIRQFLASDDLVLWENLEDLIPGEVLQERLRAVFRDLAWGRKAMVELAEAPVARRARRKQERREARRVAPTLPR